MGKFPDYVPPTKIAYLDGRPAEIHLRKCKFVVETSGRRREKVFDKALVTLGAMEDNDLVVNEETVSRYHCKVVQDENGYILVDLNSTNGTFINRVRIREAFLKSGCTVQLGKVEMKFFFADEKVPVVPSQKERLGSVIGRNVKMREIYILAAILRKSGIAGFR